MSRCFFNLSYFVFFYNMIEYFSLFLLLKQHIFTINIVGKGCCLIMLYYCFVCVSYWTTLHSEPWSLIVNFKILVFTAPLTLFVPWYCVYMKPLTNHLAKLQRWQTAKPDSVSVFSLPPRVLMLAVCPLTRTFRRYIDRRECVPDKDCHFVKYLT